jgi:hypothetical protein
VQEGGGEGPSARDTTAERLSLLLLLLLLLLLADGPIQPLLAAPAPRVSPLG